MTSFSKYIPVSLQPKIEKKIKSIFSEAISKIIDSKKPNVEVLVVHSGFPTWNDNRIKSYCEENDITVKTSNIKNLPDINENTLVFSKPTPSLAYNNLKNLVKKSGAGYLNHPTYLDDVEVSNILCSAGVSCFKAVYFNGDIYNTFLEFRKYSPFIIKPISSRNASKSFLVDSSAFLESAVGIIDDDLIVREYQNLYDSIYVIDGKIAGAIRGNSIGKHESVDVNGENSEIAIKTAKVLKSNWVMVGVNSGKVVEVELNPSMEIIDRVIPSLMESLLCCTTNSTKWLRCSTTCHYEEDAEFSDFGSIKAKLDTGNGAICFINTSGEVVEKEGMLTFKINSKSVVKPVYKKIGVKTGGLVSQDKSVIRLDFKLKDKTYRNIEFMVEYNPNKGTSASISRGFMRDSKIIVSP